MKRRPSRQAKTDTTLLAEIHAAHAISRGTYGAPRLRAELTAKAVPIPKKSGGVRILGVPTWRA
jgi:putative transposase